jgi:hypothetical protein
MDVIYIANTNVVELADLVNGMTGATVTGATVSVTLTDSTGTSVTLATGSSWPLTMAAASGATGSYRATLPHTLTLTTGATYYADVTASGGDGLYGSWHVPLRAARRT